MSDPKYTPRHPNAATLKRKPKSQRWKRCGLRFPDQPKIEIGFLPIMVVYPEYPDIMEPILSACNLSSLLALRATNSDMCKLVDGHLGRKYNIYFFHGLVNMMRMLG
ncbi:hypothetical protein CspHIS471_0302720 [Cutaneotrichosporon sp. HIS471]|nr:hypothetical protein CspHIS471_0302720 [Cutaneotrichosporon sp. HIS471]